MSSIAERQARDQLHKTPILDQRKDCERCGRSFRCPSAQAQRVTCGPCS